MNQQLGRTSYNSLVMSKVDRLWDRYKIWSKEATVDFLGKKFGQVYGHVIATN
jgi:hypothetical protein